ncbi:DUF4153 domain-containing protein [Sphingomonas colocasiae]|uniref:DUF4153 domain-containing protein n=1 Tax=Sphingomonas colocasiae TaxID=1848973 RepID=A0ABS7PIK8_9SPHN|nr:DUF4153 domain-containing protein [Sphingomonas colocasiae]MBY8821123.1 DUF4153 domain-containing protein [Sphingomonas colocasiae]
MTEAIERRDDWAWRPWLLAGLGGIAGLLVHLIMGEDHGFDAVASWQLSVAMFVIGFAVLLGYTLERVRWQWSLVFAVISALILAAICRWNGTPNDWSAAESWRMVCAFLSVAIAAPLFQTARDRGAWRFPYAEVHGHAWTNVVIWFASAAFVGVVFLLTLLLSELFSLIGIRLIRDALDAQWFVLLLIGVSLGAAVGVFRKRDGITRMLLKVVVALLGVLAPVMGAGLLLFLASLPFTGLAALWDATKATTPILLSCVVGALVLANVVIGDSDEDENRFPPLRWGAMALALTMLPLAVIAAISTGARIRQYGFTPDRLWALTFVIVACAFGLAYLVALVRGRTDWAKHVRPANLRLAFGLCGLALFLALPILSFNAISTRDQVARLESGRIAPDRFDWAALRFDFGEPGKAAITRLTSNGNTAIRAGAVQALKAEDRWALSRDQENKVRAERVARELRIIPAKVPLPGGLLESFGRFDRYVDQADKRAYALFYKPGDTVAILISYTCDGCVPDVDVRRLSASGNWEQFSVPYGQGDMSGDELKARNRLAGEAIAHGTIEIRNVERHQVFVNGNPVGEVFE